MRTGTLCHLPRAISCRGSPGTLSPSTTACQPRYFGSSRASIFMFCWKRYRAIAFWTHSHEPTFLDSSSETQSASQILCAGSLFRHASSSCCPEHPVPLRMKAVRSSLTVRDQMSAGGEWKITRSKSPADPGDTMWTRMAPAPSLWPCKVTWCGSPPKARMFLCTQRRAACWSCRPKLSVTLSRPPRIQPKMPRRKSKLMKIVGYLAERTTPSPWRRGSWPEPCWFIPPWK
mmetsp:Transcript_96676/g.268774  ORF Transcript_96676/g.268774 Transcript_96676/m.268774 type:complete len:231 (+) Transcript_96676:707-1399(+)